MKLVNMIKKDIWFWFWYNIIEFGELVRGICIFATLGLGQWAAVSFNGGAVTLPNFIFLNTLKNLLFKT